MPDATYDAIIVGAGHNGLCTAAYLQRAGLKVAICERRHEEAGGVNTEEPMTQGFFHNLHAQYMEFNDYMPFYHDFELWKFGARFVRPDAQIGLAFQDDRPPLILYHWSMPERTYESLARFSKADAELWTRLNTQIHEMDPLVPSMLYNPPPPARPGSLGGFADLNPDLYAQLLEDLDLDPYLMGKSPKVIMDEIFESPELRALLYRTCPDWGTDLEMDGGGAGFLISVLWIHSMSYLSVGGTHTFGHAMAQAALHEGVDIQDNSEVTEIIVEGGVGGRATGVRLADGTTIRATKMVVSNADPRQTFLDLIGAENLSPLWAKRARNYRYGPTHVLATSCWNLHEAPNYKGAKWDPEINRCFYTAFGLDTPEDALEIDRAARRGEVPEKCGIASWCNTQWDPSQAPPGKHAVAGWFYFPPASALTETEWRQVRATYNQRLLDTWANYAPNMTRANVIADMLYTPDQMVTKNRMQEGDFSNGRFDMAQLGGSRPWPEAGQYRTEIEGLYLCGPCTHPGGGVGAYCGYNAWKIIAEDYNLPRLWEQTDRVLY